MVVTTDKLDDVHPHLTLSSLKTLTLHLDGTKNTIGSIIRNSKSVRFLESSRVFTIESSTLWESIASLPRLEGLGIRNQYSGETDALWEACSRLKKLCFVNLRFKGIPAFATTGTSLELTFHLLRDLILSNRGFDIAVQVMLTTECQNLERLKWRIDQYLIGDATQLTG